MLYRRELPEVGELVVGTVKQIEEHGVYIALDEFGGLIAYLPKGEISSRWVRNIRDYVREDQRSVFKVIRVDRRKKQVDVSLRRVTPSERRQKVVAWKRAVKAHKLLEIIANKLNLTLDETYDKVGWKLEDKYGEIYAGLEEAVIRGIDALLEAGVPEDIARVVKEEAEKHIEIKKVKITGIMYLYSINPKGILHIKEVLSSALNVELPRGVNVRLYTVGAPRYRVEVVAEDYKVAEDVLSKMLSSAESKARDLDVAFKFEREKLGG